MKTNNLFKSSLLLLATASIGLVSCKKDKDPVPAPAKPNENEVITTFILVMTEVDPISRVAPLRFTWKDMDGDGPVLPTIPTIVLQPNKVYNTNLIILDETKTPVDTTSNEIKEEGYEHQFFFKPTVGLNLEVKYADFDKNGVPLGLVTTFTTKAASTGNITIVLKHQPDAKPKTGQGDESKGSTDINISLPVKIQEKVMELK